MRSRFFPRLAAFILFASVATGQTSFEVIGWNVESGGADPAVNAQRISAAQGVEIWGLSEALSSSVNTYTTAAAAGENASFTSILGTTGGGDRMVIIYNSDRFQEIENFELDEINIGGNVRAPLVARFRDQESG